MRNEVIFTHRLYRFDGMGLLQRLDRVRAGWRVPARCFIYGTGGSIGLDPLTSVLIARLHVYPAACRIDFLDMTLFRSTRTPVRFAVWLVSTLPVTLGVDALGYLLPASGLKFNLLITLQIVCNLVVGWCLGLIRCRNGNEIGTAILAIMLSLAMPAILIVLAIVSTLFCGIDACGQ